jgi:hypothetical protein
MMVPIIILLNLLQVDAGNARYALYPMMILPSIPAILLVMYYVNLG